MIVHLSHRLVHLWMIWSQYNLCIVLHPGTPLLPLYYTCFHLCAALRRFSKALTLLTCISGVHFNGSSWAISLQSRREKLQDYNSLPEWKVNAFNRFFLRSLDAFRRGCVYFFLYLRNIDAFQLVIPAWFPDYPFFLTHLKQRFCISECCLFNLE